ncbi:hypothetical protein [Methanoculleus sp.]|uniref:hypothetical protein n=1 Tax=Methanoculleus sp. TaxID=90427 RepID=UPI0025DACC3F|nr:hypothetical protein [Methanoculleus sp.]MCK9319875.1 hypothetical protein [Methanoculleus sp.]MDD3382927.1 hypothetical protein [Bacilli bacterium]
MIKDKIIQEKDGLRLVRFSDGIVAVLKKHNDSWITIFALSSYFKVKKYYKRLIKEIETSKKA